MNHETRHVIYSAAHMFRGCTGPFVIALVFKFKHLFLSAKAGSAPFHGIH